MSLYTVWRGNVISIMSGSRPLCKKNTFLSSLSDLIIALVHSDSEQPLNVNLRGTVDDVLLPS